MLINLLPGLRDVRTPLTVGFIYFFTAWVVFGDALPERGEAVGLMKSIYDLYGFIGKPALMAAVSFMAYICGALIGSFIGWGFFWARMPFTSPTLEFKINDMARADLAAYIFSKLHEVPYGQVRYGGPFEWRPGEFNPRDRAILALERTIPSEERELYKEIETRLAYEQDQLRVKLLVSNPEIYAEHDRHRAEAEFRAGVGVAGAALFISLTLAVAAYWIFAMIIPAACLIAGEAKRRESNDVLVQAVIAGELVPSMIAETIEQWRATHGPPASSEDGNASV
ncbi:hypothetical protein [Streptomyces bluensis]|uniref:Integral membrane protein n=1 Tax=Streptomyces bluensis TaxID=33897 RepID=A0ABW6UL74_9ACTN